jgi:hypothetical protein
MWVGLSGAEPASKLEGQRKKAGKDEITQRFEMDMRGSLTFEASNPEWAVYYYKRPFKNFESVSIQKHRGRE